MKKINSLAFIIISENVIPIVESIVQNLNDDTK
ncbi:unknown [Tannerella sp. CAG:118]|nr:unknown [Tannerella sp. CAG:118]